MTPENNKLLITELLFRGFSIYSSITGEPLLALFREDKGAIVTAPILGHQDNRGYVKAALQSAQKHLSSVTHILIFSVDTNTIWLVPAIAFPPGGSIALTKSYESFIVKDHAGTSKTYSLSSLLKAAEETQGEKK